MKKVGLLLLLLLYTFTIFCQNSFKSKRYNYSLTIPKGWTKSNNVTFSKVDAKIVDGKGNSFIVSVDVFNEIIPKSITEMYGELSDEEIIEMFDASFGSGTMNLTKRGTTYIDNKHFYYIHFLSDTKNGKMLNKMFFYCQGHTMLAINMSCYNSENLEVGPYLSSMLTSFKIGLLK